MQARCSQECNPNERDKCLEDGEAPQLFVI